VRAPRHTPRLAVRVATRRGYTIVELLMAMTVFAIGVTGIAAMQKITLASNLHAKKLAIATHIAQSWQERLTADTALWRSNSVTPTGTQWLANVGNDWVRAPTNTAGTFGATFGPLGDFTSSLNEAYFCVDIRLTNMTSTGANVIRGNGLIRSEVRVFWPREGRESSSNASYCAPNVGATIGAGSEDDYHFVYDVAAVRQTQ